MAENLVINGTTYPEVEAITAQNEEGNPVAFYPDAVRYNAQTLTEAQQAQARENIGAASQEAVKGLSEEIVDLLPKNQGSANVGKILVVGTDGNLTLTDMPEGSSGDVTGVLDEANNILLTGNLADGTYTIRYAYEDGTYSEPVTLEVGSIATYTITQNLTAVTSDNSVTEVREGESITVNLTANSGYNMKSIAVTMGGTDITSTAVSGNKVTIASVTGDVVITAVAEEPNYTNLADPTSADWGTDKRIGSDGTFRDQAGVITTNYIALPLNGTVYVEGMDLTAYNCGYYNDLKAVQSVAKLTSQTTYFKDITATANGGQATHTRNYGSGKVGYIRFVGVPTGSVNDIIITVNEPIA